MGVPGSQIAGPTSRVRLRWLASLGAAGLLAAGVAAAPRAPALAQTPVFRVGADLVVVDLVPTSDAGRFVDDLTAGDIQVFEDGKPQRVEFLRLVRPGQLISEITASSGGSVATSPGAEAVRSVAGAGPHLVIVIDQQSISSAALIATRKELADRDIVSALQYPALFIDDDLDVETVAEGGKLKVTVFIAPGTIALTTAGDVHSSDIAIHAVLRDSQGKLVGGKSLFAKDVALRLRADRLAALRASDSIEVPTLVLLPKSGTYTLTVVARHSNMRLATNVKAVTVP